MIESISSNILAAQPSEISTINNSTRRQQPIDRHQATRYKLAFNMAESGCGSRGRRRSGKTATTWPRGLIVLFLLLFFIAASIATGRAASHAPRTFVVATNRPTAHSHDTQHSKVQRQGDLTTRNGTKDNLLIDAASRHGRKSRRRTVTRALYAQGDPYAERSSRAADASPEDSAVANLTITSSMASALISTTAMPPLSATTFKPTMIPTSTTPSNISQYATVNYNGIIGVNATDPFAIATESRTFALPIGIQILMCLLYGTLAFTAVTSNMTVCYIVLSNQRMRTATNYFIVNLAVGDILMALLCIPFTFPANLIFQYWPFGLSLCVIVSYSQANSVFISAYTMVAISIDKYIAIMYPMRLRMPKNQAKLIILVIWLAALTTSLPTALLSSLTPAQPDLGPPQPSSNTIDTTTPASILTSPSTSSAAQGFTSSKSHEQSSHAMGEASEQQQRSVTTSSSSSLFNISSNTTPSSPMPSFQEQIQQQQQNQEYEEQKKYFCQESWLVWPGGKYYYSMALMILQFVVPLFVLVVTYTRIVIVVWGKRVPGEEDNARDARMARSKRKMIRMVILCVIAFALTWLPFNALIVIGDVRPDIWENQNIMYIWFITHYLAMCHTITNPLIYIWMNNRFRAGFTQVVGDVCRFLHRLFAYLLCHCLCLGCCLDCSRQKYARVELRINRKRARRGPLASSGSIHAHNNNNYNHNNGKSGTSSNLQHHQQQQQQQQHHHYNTQTTTKTLSANNYCTTVTSSAPMNAGSGGRGNNVAAEPNKSSCPTNCATIFINTAGNDSARPRPGASASGAPREPAPGESARAANRALDCTDGGQQPSEIPSQSCTGQILAATAEDIRSSKGKGAQLSAPSATASARGLSTCLRQPRLFRRSKDMSDKAGGGETCSHSVIANRRGQSSDADANKFSPDTMCSGTNLHDNRQRQRLHGVVASTNGQYGQSDVTDVLDTNKKKKRRKKHGHGISLQMVQYCRPSISTQAAGAHRGGCAGASDSAVALASQKPTTSKWRTVVGVRRAKSKQQKATFSADCPSCRHANSGLFGGSNAAQSSSTVPGDSANTNARFEKFVYDFRNSSQSTATISAQTNNTSLAISPINSLGTAVAPGGGGLNGSANTSVSLSPSGLGSAACGPDKLGSLSRRASGNARGTAKTNCRAPLLDNSITVIRQSSTGSKAQVHEDSQVAPAESDSRDGGNVTTTGAAAATPAVVRPSTAPVDGGLVCPLSAQGDDLKLVGCDATGGGEQIKVHSTGPTESVSSPLDSAGCPTPGKAEINVGEQRHEHQHYQEHLPRRRQSADAGAVGCRLHVNEIDAHGRRHHHRHRHHHSHIHHDPVHGDSQGTSSGATSLESHQLASTSESCNQSDPAQSRLHLIDDDDGGGGGCGNERGHFSSQLKHNFCPEHRQTASAAEVNPRGHHYDYHRREMSFPPHAAGQIGDCLKINNAIASDVRAEPHRQTATVLSSPPNESDAHGQTLTCDNRKSSSTYELVSEHLLHVRRLPYTDSSTVREQRAFAEQASSLENGSNEEEEEDDDDDEDDDSDGHDVDGRHTHDGEEEDDSSLEAEYGDIRTGFEFGCAVHDYDPAEMIRLRPMVVRDGSTKRVRQRNRLFSSTSDGLCSTHSHDDNRKQNDNERKLDTREHRAALVTVAPSQSSPRSALNGGDSEWQLAPTNNKPTRGSNTLLNFCDIQNKKQHCSRFHEDELSLARKSSLHNCAKQQQQQHHHHYHNHHYQTNSHTKSMSPIHLGGYHGNYIMETSAPIDSNRA